MAETDTLPDIDGASWEGYQKDKLLDYAKEKIAPPPAAPAPTDLAAPLPQETAATISASGPDSNGGPALASRLESTTPAPEPAMLPPVSTEPTPVEQSPRTAELPSWLPEPAKQAVEAFRQKPLATQDPEKSAALSIGSQQIGKPYAGPIVGQPESARWGSVGWDCSSFVSGVYKQMGVQLPAFTDAIASATERVKPGDERPGDIILYKYRDPYQPGVQYPHTGLWAGGGKMMDAAYGQGVGVHPLLNQPYEIRRPAGFAPADASDVVTTARSFLPTAAQMPTAAQATKLTAELPPVDTASAQGFREQSLWDHIGSKIDELKQNAGQAPGGFMDYVQQKMAGLGQAASGAPGAVGGALLDTQAPLTEAEREGVKVAVPGGWQDAVNKLRASTDLATGAPDLNALTAFPGQVATNIGARMAGETGSPSLPPDTIAPGKQETPYEASALGKTPLIGGAVEAAVNPLTYAAIPGAAEAKAAQRAEALWQGLRDVPSMAGGASTAGADAVRAADPGLADFVQSVNGGTPAKTDLGQKLRETGQLIERMFVDERAPVNAVSTAAEEANVAYRGRTGSSQMFLEDNLGPVYDALQARNGANQALVDHFNAYIAAQNYIERAGVKGASRLGPGGITSIPDATAFLARLDAQVGPAGMAQIQKADELRQAAMHTMLQEKVATGYLTQDMADTLERLYPHYNPVNVLLAIDHAEGAGPIAGSRLTQIGNTLKRLSVEGSPADQMPAMDSAALALSQGHTNMIRNDTVKTVLDGFKGQVDAAGEAIIPIKPAIEVRTGPVISTSQVQPPPVASGMVRLYRRQEESFDPSRVGEPGQMGRQGEQGRWFSSDSNYWAGVHGEHVAYVDVPRATYEKMLADEQELSRAAGDNRPADWTSVLVDPDIARRAQPFNSPSPLPDLASIITHQRGDVPGTISFWNDGKRYIADMRNVPELERAMKNLDGRQLNVVSQVASLLNLPLREGATALSVPFQLRQGLYSDVEAWIRQGVKPIGRTGGVTNAYWEVLSKSEGFKDYIRRGGSMGGLSGQQAPILEMWQRLVGKTSPEDQAARLSSMVRDKGGYLVNNPGDLLRVGKQLGIDALTLKPIRAVAQAGLYAPRYAAYQKALSEGASIPSAVMTGRQGIADYSRTGWAMREVNAFVPFANAAMQHTLGIARSIRDNPSATLTKLAVLDTMVAASYAWNRQFPEQYADIPEYEKANSLVLLLPGAERNPNGVGFTKNPHIAVNLRQLGALPYLIIKGLEAADGKNPDFGDALGRALISSSPAPEILGNLRYAGLGVLGKEFAQQESGPGGYDTFKGRPIVSESLQNLPPGAQATPQTSPSAIGIAAAFNRSPLVHLPLVGGEKSPVRIEHAIEAVTGGFGKTALQGVDTAAGKPSDLPPVVGSVVSGVYKNYGGQTEQTMYNQRDKKMAELSSQYREILEPMAKNGANVGPPPQDIEGIALRPQEQAEYRGYQLEFLSDLFKGSAGLNELLQGFPNEDHILLDARASILKDLAQESGKYAQAMIVSKLGADEIGNRVIGKEEPDPRKLYPLQQYSPVGGK